MKPVEAPRRTNCLLPPHGIINSIRKKRYVQEFSSLRSLGPYQMTNALTLKRSQP